MKSAGKARNNGLYRHIRTSKEIIRNLLNDFSKSLSLAFSNFHFSPRYNNHDPKPLSRKTQGLFLCLEVSILLFRTITIIITIVF